MKKQIINIICLTAITILISYILAILNIEFKLVWFLSFLVFAYLTCATTNRFIRLSTALFTLLAGIIITHIPWWWSHHINYDISFGTLFEYFLMGTPMFYSILGAISGYLLYKLTKLFALKK